MGPIPILVYSDNPALMTGLARITRHIATLLSNMPEFRVGTFGRGGIANRMLPWTQYYYPESAEWGQDYLPIVWHNFAGAERGIIFTIMDAARMHWFARPKYIKQEGALKTLLESDAFERWGYFPIDHIAPTGTLSEMEIDTVRGYDKVLGYTIFGANVLSRILGREVTWVPHGLNEEVFKPRGREGIRFAMGFPEGSRVVGMVATNQVRKEWGLACAVIRELLDRGHDIVFWACIDEPTRYWNIYALLHDYRIEEHTLLMRGSQLDDKTLSHYYSLCDVTILPTAGEGFGYPVVESMACGTPCITVNYAGGAELVPRKEWLVEPANIRCEAPINALRPVTNLDDWVERIEYTFGMGDCVQECVQSVTHLFWSNLGAVWKRWFKEAVKDFRREVRDAATSADTQIQPK